MLLRGALQVFEDQTVGLQQANPNFLVELHVRPFCQWQIFSTYI